MITHTAPRPRRHRPTVRRALARHERALRWLIDLKQQRVQDAATPADRRSHEWEHEALIGELDRHIQRWGAQS